jgi:hypothetical protein
VKAEQSNTFLFTYGYVEGSLVFQDEVYPGDTMMYNITIIANLDLRIYNFTMKISGMVGETWLELEKEEIEGYDLMKDENITRQITIILPSNISKKIYCIVEVSTDKGFGRNSFYTTYVRERTYHELENLYDDLSANYSTLEDEFNDLLYNYNYQNQTFNLLLSELQGSYDYIKTKYDASIRDSNLFRNLMYIFSITTLIFVATTLYLRKKEPYIIVRKETAIKPEK